MLSLMMILAMASTPPLILDGTGATAGECSSVASVVSDLCIGDFSGVQDMGQASVLPGGEGQAATGCSMAAGSPSGPVGAALLWLLLWSVSMRRRGSDPIR